MENLEKSGRILERSHGEPGEVREKFFIANLGTLYMVNKFYEQNKNNLLSAELFSFAISYARNQLERVDGFEMYYT